MTYTFRGGVELDEYKNTRRCQIQRIKPPESVILPMSQHIGAPSIPVVKVGDSVDKGQLIGKVEAGLGCPVHAPISGKVTAITERFSANGAKIQNIIIKNDFMERISPDIKPFEKRLLDTEPDEIIDIIRDAGISGMGGATFPTHAKIRSAMGKVKHLIVNCAECEPFITANHRLLLEQPASVINGLKILIRCFGLRSGIIAVEDNKLDAVKKLDKLIGDNDLIKLRVMRTKYPQGDERQLIYALTGIELKPGKLPADVGCVIFNAETCAAIFNAFATGMPLIERVVTVDGDCVKNPSNLLVPLGTPFRNLIDFCGGLIREPKKLIAGGPMMGVAQWDINSPVVKGTSALLAFSKNFEGAGRFEQEPTCIGCGKCVGVCPMHLMPSYLAKLSQAELYDEAEEYDVMACVECGACSYICPGYVPITQRIRIAKAKINAKRKGGK